MVIIGSFGRTLLLIQNHLVAFTTSRGRDEVVDIRRAPAHTKTMYLLVIYRYIIIIYPYINTFTNIYFHFEMTNEIEILSRIKKRCWQFRGGVKKQIYDIRFLFVL